VYKIIKYDLSYKASMSIYVQNSKIKMGRKTNNKMGMMFGIVIVLAIVILGMTFSMKNTPAPTSAVSSASAPQVQCAKSFSKTVNFVTRDFYDKGTSVNNVTYKVWKKVGNVKVPQPNALGTLTVGYDESYEVVATANGYKSSLESFTVDQSCNGPSDKVFYLTKLPTTIDVTFENSKITGPNSITNRIPFTADVTRNVKGIFNGMSKTSTDAIIVIDASKTQFVVSSSLASATLPEEHTTATGFKSYTYNLGTFDGSSDLLANFDLTADRNVTLGNQTLTYTIYQFQTGYVDYKSGEWVNTPAIEHNRLVLLPTFTGNIEVVAQ